MPRSESGKKELVSEVSVSAAVSASGVNESGPVSESGLKEPVSLLFTGTLTRDSDTRSLIQDIRSTAPIVVWSIVLRSRFLLVKQGQKIEVDGVLAISFMELNDPPVAEYVPA